MSQWILSVARDTAQKSAPYRDTSEFDTAGGVSYKTVYFFTLVGLLVLLIAWVNYVNLSTARAVTQFRGPL